MADFVRGLRTALALALVSTIGCFLDAVGEAGSGDTGAAGAATTSSGTGASAADGAGATGGMPGVGGVPSVGGAGGGGGNSPDGGGGSGSGGAPCDGVLTFNGAQVAQVAGDSVDQADDFSFGARARPDQDPKFAIIGGAGSVVLRRASFNDDRGYFVWFVEQNDDGAPHAQVGIRNGSGGTCRVNAPTATPWGQWVSIAGRYRRDAGGDDLFLYLDGNFVGSNDCGDADIPSLSKPLEIGATLEDPDSFFVGRIDDIFVRAVADLPVPATDPITCPPQTIAAFSFNGTLSSICSSPSLTATLGIDPSNADVADPQVECGP